MQRLGILSDGRPVDYEAVTRTFFIAGLATTCEQVTAADQLGHVVWGSEAIRGWFRTLTAPPPTDSALSGFFPRDPRRRRSVILALIVVAMLIPVLSCCVLASNLATFDDAGSTGTTQESASVASVETTVQREQAALEAVRTSGQYKRLAAGGMNDEQARSAISAAEVAGVKYIGEVISSDRADDGESVYLVASKDGDVDVQYGIIFKGDRVTEIRDTELVKLYSKGKRNKKYIFWEDVGGPIRIRDTTAEALSGILKSPSTASFPGGFFDPLEGWAFKKTAGRITVSSYVDSQNSFGATIRSKFKIILDIKKGEDGPKIRPVYINFDGHVEDMR